MVGVISINVMKMLYFDWYFVDILMWWGIREDAGEEHRGRGLLWGDQGVSEDVGLWETMWDGWWDRLGDLELNLINIWTGICISLGFFIRQNL